MIIDAHTHIFPAFFRDKRNTFFEKEPAFEMLYGPQSSKMASFQNLLEIMDAEGVDKSIVFGFPWKTADYFKRHNDYIIEAVNTNPGRLMPRQRKKPQHKYWQGIAVFSMAKKGVIWSSGN